MRSGSGAGTHPHPPVQFVPTSSTRATTTSTSVNPVTATFASKRTPEPIVTGLDSLSHYNPTSVNSTANPQATSSSQQQQQLQPIDAHSQLTSLSLSPTPEFSSPRSVSSLVPLSTHNSPTRSTGHRSPWSPAARKRSYHNHNHKQDVTGSASLSTSPKASTRKHQHSSQHQQQHPPPQTVADYIKAQVREQRSKEDYKVALEKLQQSSLDDDMLSSFKRECMFSLILSSHTSVTRSGRRRGECQVTTLQHHPCMRPCTRPQSLAQRWCA